MNLNKISYDVFFHVGFITVLVYECVIMILYSFLNFFYEPLKLHAMMFIRMYNVELYK